MRGSDRNSRFYLQKCLDMEESSRGKEVGSTIFTVYTTHSSSLPYFTTDLPRAYNRTKGETDKRKTDGKEKE